jgi:hypothetical protein
MNKTTSSTGRSGNTANVQSIIDSGGQSYDSQAQGTMIQMHPTGFE